MKHIIIGAVIGYFLLPVLPIFQHKIIEMAQGNTQNQVASYSADTRW